MLADADAHTSGSKAAACGRLASLSAVSDKGNVVVIGDCIFSSPKKLLHHEHLMKIYSF